MKFSKVVIMVLTLVSLYYLISSVHSMRGFRIIRSRTTDLPCHSSDGPMDLALRCEDSTAQIILHSNQAKQKRNLIIFDIDLTILEAIEGYHKAIPAALRNNGQKRPIRQFYDKALDINLLLIEVVVHHNLFFRSRSI